MLDTLFGRVTAGEVMSPHPLAVSPHLSLLELVDGALLPRAQRAALVTEGDQLLGLISLTGIRQIPREQWAEKPVGLVMVPRHRLAVTSPRQRLSDALSLLVSHNIHQLPVVQGDRLAGMISRETIMRFLEVRWGLGLEEAEEVEKVLSRAGESHREALEGVEQHGLRAKPGARLDAPRIHAEGCFMAWWRTPCKMVALEIWYQPGGANASSSPVKSLDGFTGQHPKEASSRATNGTFSAPLDARARAAASRVHLHSPCSG